MYSRYATTVDLSTKAYTMNHSLYINNQLYAECLNIMFFDFFDNSYLSISISFG